MPDFKDRMADYVPVNERIEAFKNDWPDGSLQSSIVELTASRVTIKAFAYRTPDDQRPGIGHSSLEIPGATPYTRGSEIENAETSAWGRAIAALGFEVKRGLASAEEVRNKQPGQDERLGGATPRSRPVPVQTHPATGVWKVQRTPNEAALLEELLLVPGMTKARMSLLADTVGVKAGDHASESQLREMLARTVIETPEPARAHAAATAEGAEGARTSAPEPTLDDVLAVTGGELVEPKGKGKA